MATDSSQASYPKHVIKTPVKIERFLRPNKSSYCHQFDTSSFSATNPIHHNLIKDNTSLPMLHTPLVPPPDNSRKVSRSIKRVSESQSGKNTVLRDVLPDMDSRPSGSHSHTVDHRFIQHTAVAESDSLWFPSSYIATSPGYRLPGDPGFPSPTEVTPTHLLPQSGEGQENSSLIYLAPDNLEEGLPAQSVLPKVPSRYYENLPIKLKELLSSSSDTEQDYSYGQESGTDTDLSVSNHSAGGHVSMFSSHSREVLFHPPVSESHHFPSVSTAPLVLHDATPTQQHPPSLDEVSFKYEMAKYFHQRQLLKKCLRALLWNKSVAMETAKMAIWRHSTLKLKLLWKKWLSAVKHKQSERCCHFFLRWKRLAKLHKNRKFIMAKRSMGIVKSSFLLWRTSLQFELNKEALKQVWKRRIAQSCLVQWKVQLAKRRSSESAMRVALVHHVLVLKQTVFMQWRTRTQRSVEFKQRLNLTLLQRAFIKWKSAATLMRSKNSNMDMTALHTRNLVLLRKGMRKWYLKLKLRIFEKRTHLCLRKSGWQCWCQKLQISRHNKQKAVCFHLKTLLKRSWSTLKENSRNYYMKQELCFLYQQKVTLKTCFVAWRLYIYRVTLKKALLQYHSSKKHKSLQVHFDQWLLSTRQREEDCALSLCASRASQKRNLRRALGGWRAVCRCSTAERLVTRCTQMSLLLRTFNVWRKRTHESQNFAFWQTSTNMNIKMAVLRRWKLKTFSALSADMADRFHRTMMLKCCLQKWTMVYTQSQRARCISSARESQLVQKGFTKWKRDALQRRHLKLSLTCLLLVRESEMKGMVWRNWRKAIHTQKMLKDLAARHRRRLLQTCFLSWHMLSASATASLEVSFISNLHRAVHRSDSLSSSSSVQSLWSYQSLPPPAVVVSCSPLLEHKLSQTGPDLQSVKRELFSSSQAGNRPLYFTSSTPHSLPKGKEVPLVQCGVTSTQSEGRGPVEGVSIRESLADGHLSRSQLALEYNPIEDVETATEETLTSMSQDSLCQEVSFLSVGLCDCIDQAVKKELQDLDDETLVTGDSITSHDGTSHETCDNIRPKSVFESRPLLMRPEAYSNVLLSDDISKWLPFDSSLHLSQNLLASPVAQQLVRMIRIWQLYPCGGVFNQWRQFTAWKKRLRSSKMEAFQLHRLTLLRLCFMQWRDAKRKLANFDIQGRDLEEHFQQKQLTRMVLFWKEKCTTFQQVHSIRTQQALSFCNVHLEQKHFFLWKRQTLLQQLLSQHNRTQVYNKLKQAYGCWRTLTVQQQTDKEQLQATIASRQRSQLLLQAFTQWKNHFVKVLQLNDALVHYTVAQNERLLAQSFITWHGHYKEKLLRYHHQLALAKKAFNLRCMQKSFFAWRNSTRVQRGRISRLQTNADNLRNLVVLRRSLHLWKLQNQTERRQHFKSKTYRCNTLVRQAFTIWRRRLHAHLEECSHTIGKAAEFDQQHRLKMALKSWQKLVIIAQSERAERILLLQKKWQKRRLKVYVARWHQRTKMVILANNHGRFTRQFRFWRKWRISLIERETVKRVVSTDHFLLKQKIFLSWRRVCEDIQVGNSSLLSDSALVAQGSRQSETHSFGHLAHPTNLLLHSFSLWKIKTDLQTIKRQLPLVISNS